MENDIRLVCRDLRAIAADPIALQRICKRIAKEIATGRLAGDRVRIAVLSTFLVDMLIDVLRAALLARGVVADIVKGAYGAIAVDLLSEKSITRDCDLVIVLPTHRDLAFVPQPGCSQAEDNAAVEQEVAVWTDLWARIKAPIVQLSFDPPPWRALSEGDGFRPGGHLRHVRCVNQKLGELAPAQVALVDAEALARTVGQAWHDARTYFLCKQPFAPSAVWEVADSIAAASAGLLGKARKVLVLDLDNTLWGGVIGDVGLTGIVLGSETHEGEAFVAVQRYAKSLAARGIILAVCSKNRDEIAREPFRAHSGMVLREGDIACFVANFEDKVANLRRIAQALNVGLDALVFVDDNPVERAWVKQELPEVLVVNLPDDPALYCQAIESARAFPTHRVTAEDLGRNASYRSRAIVAEVSSEATDMGAFLRGLEPVARVERVNSGSLERIVQLVAKTNQFKLNPRTFSAEEVLQRAQSTGNVIAVRLKDRLQDYGIVTVAITEFQGEEVTILNWVMSCRVFSRRLEHATLELIRANARAAGAARIRATFVPSSKNAVAREVLTELGFTPAGDADWVVPTVPEVPLESHFMHIESGEEL